MHYEHRIEQNTILLGTRDVPADALHGIYTERAIENFPLALRPVNPAPDPCLWRREARLRPDQSRTGLVG